MSTHIWRAFIALTAGIGLALCSGCGLYNTFKGKPKSFSTHPFRIDYPRAFESAELPQMSTENYMLVAFGISGGGSAQEPKTPPAMIVLRCYRLRQDETTQTFVERYYDSLAPRFLDLKLRQTRKSSTAPEWAVSAAQGLLEARLIVLPEEKLAYDVTTLATSKELVAQFKDAFKRARESFRLLPARG